MIARAGKKMSPERRQDMLQLLKIAFPVVRTANELVRRHGLTLPVDIAALCGHYGVRMVTLSELERRGMSREAVFAVWGNRDGVAMSGRRGRAIGYNDRVAEKRIRFTLAEELMHLLLGHTADRRFAVASQSYDEELYARYEPSTARACCSSRPRSISAIANCTARRALPGCAASRTPVPGRRRAIMRKTRKSFAPFSRPSRSAALSALSSAGARCVRAASPRTRVSSFQYLVSSDACWKRKTRN